MRVAEADRDVSWRRLSARMLLVYPVREVAGALPALLGLLVAGRAVGNGESWWWGPLAVVGVMVLSVLRWATTRYRITPEQVQLRTGLLRRKTIASPADRIRSVDVTASALHRILGLAKVEIGTGSHDKGSVLSLDSLPVAQAAALRAELLHRSPARSLEHSAAATDGAGVVGDATTGGGHDSRDTESGDARFLDANATDTDSGDTELARWDPRWVRFAPFTMSGVLGAAAVLGLGSRLLDQLGVDAGEVGPVRGGLAYLERTPIWLDILQGLVALVAFVTLLSIGGYVLSYWGFRLTRHAHGTLHVVRGLLTTRATSIEEVRLRGVELAEPLLLRAVHAARLSGITTGLTSGGAGGGSALLLPPAPRAVVWDVATQILHTPVPLDVVLNAHGPAARRRRRLRALTPSLAVVLAAVVAVWSGGPGWLVPAAALTLPAAAALAADRYRSLGHAIAGRYLVIRAGSLGRRRDVLECDGIIGWNVRQTFFQRRAGLVTLTATTAAGRQQYAVRDVPRPIALSLADRALPGMLGDFLQPADPAQT